MRQKKRKILLVTCLLLMFVGGKAQNLAIKTNALYWGAVTPNAGIELRVGNRMTTDLSGAYNPLVINEERNVRFWLAQPEFRYWFCESFEGHFMGIHIHGAQYYSILSDKIYDGYLAGGGLTYGYSWILSSRWNLEALIGVGYARLWYKEMPNLPCMKCHDDKTFNYVGPTKIALSLSYLF